MVSVRESVTFSLPDGRLGSRIPVAMAGSTKARVTTATRQVQRQKRLKESVEIGESINTTLGSPRFAADDLVRSDLPSLSVTVLTNTVVIVLLTLALMITGLDLKGSRLQSTMQP